MSKITPMPEEVQFEVYLSGPCHISVCTNLVDKTAVEDYANLTNAAGTQHGWKILEANFRTGETNPCACNRDPTQAKQHWLLTC